MSLLDQMDLEQWQARHLKVVGRRTTSKQLDFIRRQIRAAQAGEIRIGPKLNRNRAGAKFITFPMTADQAAKLDAAVADLGFSNRLALTEAALAWFLSAAGFEGAATAFGGAEVGQRLVDVRAAAARLAEKRATTRTVRRPKPGPRWRPLGDGSFFIPRDPDEPSRSVDFDRNISPFLRPGDEIAPQSTGGASPIQVGWAISRKVLVPA